MAGDLLQGFFLGELLVEPLKGRVTGSDGSTHLPPKATEVLVCLARSPHEIVERQILLGEAWGPGRGSNEALSHAVGEIRHALGDDADAPRFVQTLPRRGYRLLVDPVPVEREDSAMGAPAVGTAAGTGGVLENLKRRGVIETALAYLVTGWLIIQIVDAVFDKLLLPLWAGTFVTVLVMAGFPIALMFAWFLEWRDGRAVLDTGTLRPRRRISRAYVSTVGAMAIAAAGVFAYDRLVGLPAESQSAGPVLEAEVSVRENSIAVLPFENIDRSERTQIFVNGLHDDVINRLARIPGLAVASRGDAWTLTPNSPSAEVRRRLRVAYYLEGSVRVSGDAMRVVVQLIDSGTGFHIGSRDFDRRLEDFMELQREITALTVADLRIALPAERMDFLDATIESADVDAYVLYRRGKQLYDGPRSRESLEHAIDFYQRALALDPHYAAAHAGLCHAYVAVYDVSSDSVDIARAESACATALATNPNLHMVYTALGNLYQATARLDQAESAYGEALLTNPQDADAMRGLARVYQRQQKYALAEEQFHRAIDTQPGNWGTLKSLGNFLFGTGRYEEAADAYSQVAELDPDNFEALGNMGGALIMAGEFERGKGALEASIAIRPTPTVLSNLGIVHYYLGEFDDAVQINRRAVELSPGEPVKWINLADALYFAGRDQEAADAFQRAASLAENRLAVDGADAASLYMLAWSQVMLARPERAAELIRRGLEAAPMNPYGYYYDALIKTGLGQRQGALESLKKAIENGYPPNLLAVEPYLAKLKGDPDFRMLIAGESDPG